jgi:hypothetical protein
MRDSRYLWSAVINGSIALLFLIAILVLSLVPIPADIAISIIGGLVVTVLICGVIAIVHYRAYLLGKHQRWFSDRLAR